MKPIILITVFFCSVTLLSALSIGSLRKGIQIAPKTPGGGETLCSHTLRAVNWEGFVLGNDSSTNTFGSVVCTDLCPFQGVLPIHLLPAKGCIL